MIKIDREQLNEALEQLDNLDLQSDVRTDYSGRGMYGERCLGLVCSLGTAMQFMLELALALHANEHDADERLELARETISRLALDVVSDNMGRDTIYYWPSLRVKS